MYKDKIKFDDWKVMEQFIQSGVFMFKLDIKQGYHHIDIFKDHQTFLGFSWEIHGIIKYFVYTVLPFGLSTGPFVFTKLMKGLVKDWRRHGIKIGCFLDDGLGVEKSKYKLREDAEFVKGSLQCAGFRLNEEKSEWSPTQQLTWLGVAVDSSMGTFQITTKRTSSILCSVSQLIYNLPYSSARKIAKLCGKLISAKFVLGNIVQLKTRRLYKVIDMQRNWDSRCSLKDHPGLWKSYSFGRKFLTNTISGF